MSSIVKIGGQEIPAALVRFFRSDPQHQGRKTVHIAVELDYEEVKAIFSNPGKWSLVREEDVTDCTAYEMLCSMVDNQDGKIMVTMGMATDAEILAVLMGSR